MQDINVTGMTNIDGKYTMTTENDDSNYQYHDGPNYEKLAEDYDRRDAIMTEWMKIHGDIEPTRAMLKALDMAEDRREIALKEGEDFDQIEYTRKEALRVKDMLEKGEYSKESYEPLLPE